MILNRDKNFQLIWRQLIPALATIMVAVYLIYPILFTDSGFQQDWVKHMWFVWKQSLSINQTGLPTYFLNSNSLGFYYPFYLFYGGTLYSFYGYIAAFTGSASFTYSLSYAVTFAMIIGGWHWISKLIGLSGWKAWLAPLVAISSAYLLSNIYTRGSWPEFVATSTIPLLLASGYSIIKSHSVTIFSSVMFVLAVIFLTGSHNITTLFGSLFVALIALIVLVAFWSTAFENKRRLLFTLAVSAAAVCVNAWFLLPDIVLSSHTLQLGSTPHEGAVRPDSANALYQFTNLFNPLRSRPEETVGFKQFYIQLPTIVLIWSFTVAIFSIKNLKRGYGIALLLFSSLFIIIVLLILTDAPWYLLPELFNNVQFPYRLISYATICALLIFILSIKYFDSIKRKVPKKLAAAMLTFVVTVSVATAIHQVANLDPTVKDRSASLVDPNQEPYNWSASDGGAYRDRRLNIPPLTEPTTFRTVLPWETDRNRVSIDLPNKGRLVQANIFVGYDLIHSPTHEIVGFPNSAFSIFERSGPPTDKFVVEVRKPLVVKLGIALSIISVIGLLAIFAYMWTLKRKSKLFLT